MLKSAWILEEIVLKSPWNDSVSHSKLNGLVLDLARFSRISLRGIFTLTSGLRGHSRFTQIFLQAGIGLQSRRHRTATHSSDLTLGSSRVSSSLWRHGRIYPKQWMILTRPIAGLLWILETADGIRRTSSTERILTLWCKRSFSRLIRVYSFVNAQLGNRTDRLKSYSNPYMLVLWTSAGKNDFFMSLSNHRGSLNLSRKSMR